MISIQRLPEPGVLAVNKEKWLAAFLKARDKKPETRPPSSRYAHGEIKSRLEAMSFHKCFYCEQIVKGCAEVDHYVEVASDPWRAFDWDNLYLSCRDCNKHKQPHDAIAVTTCLDPCDPKVRPDDHLTFDDEVISAKDASEQGLATIQKYRLNRLELEWKRAKQLLHFYKAMVEIRNMQNHEGGRPMREEEKNVLRRFGERDFPFSLMFRTYLSKAGL